MAIVSRLIAHSGRIAGIDDEERLDLRVFQLLDFSVGVLETVLLRRRDVHDLEVVVLQMRHLEVGRENRRAERDRVAGKQQPIGLQRFEDVAHRGSAALDRVNVELAGGVRFAAHRPHQVFVHDPLVVDQHAIRHRIIVADDRIDKFVDECIGLELEGLDRKLHHRGKKVGARHVRVLRKPCVEARRDALGLRHPADSGGVLHHPLAFGDGELAEQEETFARRGRDPVGIAAAGIQERGLCRPGRFLGEV